MGVGERIVDDKLTVLDLFCGCGGLSHGFIQAGYDVLLGVDHDEAALRTYKLNHPDSEIFQGDLSDKSTIHKIKSVVGDRAIDVIIGGPPCQGFSLTGPRNLLDERNKLYLSFIQTVRELKPNAFLIENVPGLATLYNGEVKDDIIETLHSCGYDVKMQIVTAADYGVPQMRRRVVFVGIKSEQGVFHFPSPTHGDKETFAAQPPLDLQKYVSCGEALSDLPSLETDLGSEEVEYSHPPQTSYQKMMRQSSKTLFNHVATKHTQKVIDVISQVPEGGNHKDLPPGVGESRKFNEAWTRYHSKKPSRTIDTGHRNHFHYKYNRVPTIRENARLQSFPDDFVFTGTRTQQNRQVGNAVPPLLAYNLAKQIKITLKVSETRELQEQT